MKRAVFKLSLEGVNEYELMTMLPGVNQEIKEYNSKQEQASNHSVWEIEMCKLKNKTQQNNFLPLSKFF